MPAVFHVTELHVSDVVTMRFTGTRHVPARLSESAIVRNTVHDTRGGRLMSEPITEPKTRRRIGVEHIATVKRDGDVIARRVYRERGRTFLEYV